MSFESGLPVGVAAKTTVLGEKFKANVEVRLYTGCYLHSYMGGSGTARTVVVVEGVSRVSRE